MSEDEQQPEFSPEEVKLIKAGLPIISAVIGFGKVTRWVAITLLGLLAGVVLLGDSIQRIVGWIKTFAQ